MVRLIFTSLCLVFFYTSSAQYKTLGFLVGSAWSQNEISNTLSPTAKLLETGMHLGLSHRIYYPSVLAQKSTLNLLWVQGNDVNNTNSTRGLYYEATMLNIAHQIELHYINRGPFIAYSHLGLSAYFLNRRDVATTENGTNLSRDPQLSLALTTGGGILFELNNNWHIGGEINMYLTTIDNVEGMAVNADGVNDRFITATLDVSKKLGNPRSWINIGKKRQNCPAF